MKRILFFLSACALISYVSCLQEEGADFKYPQLYTDPISDITPAGARFTARIDFATLEGVSDFGFIWGGDSELVGATLTLPADNIQDQVFYTDVHSSLVDQKKYYVRSFVRKSGKIVYGNIVSFKSLGSEGPKITELAPPIAAFGDTVRVVGNNFTSNARLKYGDQDISSSIVTIEKSTIIFVLPSAVSVSPTENFISVSIEGNSSKSPLPLKLDLERILPKILSIAPSVIKACDTITLTGKNLLYETKPLELSDNFGALTVLTASNEHIVCIVKAIPREELYFRLFNGRFYINSLDIMLTELRTEIVSVSPLNYKSKDIVTIKVKNFPYCNDAVYAYIPNYNTNTRLDILSKSKDEIRVQLPEGCSGYTPIVITIPGNHYTGTAFQQFETLPLSPEPPEVHSIVPSHGTPGDEIVITGNNLKGAWVDMLDTTSTSNTEIRGILNQYATVKDNGFTDVTINSCNQLTLEDAFTYDPVEILDFYPKVITSPTEQLTIIGKNFSTGSFTNTVTIGSYTAHIGSGDPLTLSLFISALMPVSQSINESFAITVKNSMGGEVTSSASLQINYEATWSQLNPFPYPGIYLGISFSLGGKGYVGSSGSTPNFWEYDPAIDTWEEKASYPGQPGRYKVSASANGKAYVGLGQNSPNEWWEYDPTTNTWTRKNDYPGSSTVGTFAFGLGGKVYAGRSGLTEFWEYNPAMDSWTRKVDMPISGTIHFGFKDKGYVYGTASNGVSYEQTYDPNSNTWTSRRIETVPKSSNNNYMIFQDYVVVGGESLTYPNYNTFVKITPGNGYIVQAEHMGIHRKGQIGFAIDDYGYWGLGINATNYQASFEIWRFKPSQFR